MTHLPSASSRNARRIRPRRDRWSRASPTGLEARLVCPPRTPAYAWGLRRRQARSENVSQGDHGRVSGSRGGADRNMVGLVRADDGRQSPRLPDPDAARGAQILFRRGLCQVDRHLRLTTLLDYPGRLGSGLLAPSDRSRWGRPRTSYCGKRNSCPTRNSHRCNLDGILKKNQQANANQSSE